MLLQWCLCGLVLLATTAAVPDATGLSGQSLPWIPTTTEYTQSSRGLSVHGMSEHQRFPREGGVCTGALLKGIGHCGVAVEAYFSPRKWCNDELREDNRKTVCEARGGKRKAVGNPLSLAGLPALQQCPHSTQGTAHPCPLGCSVTQSYPLLWVTAPALHKGHRCTLERTAG